ncbi:ComF family protein [Kangiella sp. HZ709]|uniref:ComF family protein n=1 Tax=Kangiella sp. HZ709 TaxID=2666328 RepID=UPI0012AF7C97|nr:ComF family protein [Kangiella sp. HZ709]MRX28623.1 ComF family protein [Kangiella sp. HZ709]
MVYKRFYPVLLDAANRILAGHSCVLCGLRAESLTSPKAICQVCLAAIQLSGNCCYQCGISIKSTDGQQKCGECLHHPKPYHRLIASCHYDFPVNQAISRFKFDQQLHLGKALAKALSQLILDTYQDDELPQLLIPIPLHRKRLAERGFNQSQLIAKTISHNILIPTVVNQLIRVKNTPHQIGLKATQRKQNLKNAFKVKSQLPRHIALIDDVVTTGSTITEATKQCLKHGAETIDIWCLAKT